MKTTARAISTVMAFALVVVACGRPDQSVEIGSFAAGTAPCHDTTSVLVPGTTPAPTTAPATSDPDGAARTAGSASLPPATSIPSPPPPSPRTTCVPLGTTLPLAPGTSAPTRSANVAFDFDHDGKADYVVITQSGRWIDLSRPDTDPPLYVHQQGDRPVPADYDGSGYSTAVLRQNGDWVTESRAGTIHFPAPPRLDGFDVLPFGLQFQMVPVPADYDGEHQARVAWYRDADGTWFIQGHDPIQFGSGPTTKHTTPGGKGNDTIDQDLPVPADYDGDGKTDLAVYNPRTGVWRVRSSRDGTVSSVTMPGSSAELRYPAPGDYDGVHHAQRALFSLTGWRIEGRPDLVPLGVAGTTPGPGTAPLPGTTAYQAAADFDGDDKIDLSFVDLAGMWHTRSSADPTKVTTYTVGGLNTSSALEPVAFTTGGYASIARLTLIAKNCSPGYSSYPQDC